jgi:Carbohydrate-binding module 48 (Isoamylase N-terminal domain).
VIWIGRGLGKAWSLNQGRPLGRTLVGGSTRLGPVRVGVSVASTTFDLMRGGSLTDRTRTDTFALADTLRRELHTDFTDAMISGHWELSSLGFDLSIGRRFSRTTPEITVWGVSAMRSLGPQLGLVVAAGRAGSDPVTALPGSRYLVAGLRLTLGANRWLPRIETPSASHAARFRIGPSRLTGREIRLHAPAAQRVELAGDFTDWRPVALEPASEGDWRVVLPIAPGLHRLAVRVNGGDWQAPPDTRAVISEVRHRGSGGGYRVECSDRA